MNGIRDVCRINVNNFEAMLMKVFEKITIFCAAFIEGLATIRWGLWFRRSDGLKNEKNPPHLHVQQKNELKTE